MKEHEDVQRLIRLKKYETPGEEYFQKFAESLKDRQRSEMLKRSSVGIFAERLQVWFEETHGVKWLVPAGAAAAIAAGVIVNLPINENFGETVAESSPTVFEQSLMRQIPIDQEVIQLQLPHLQRVPGLSSDTLSEPEGLIPAGAKFREL